MNIFFITYKNNNKFKFYINFIFLFVLPQIIIGILLSAFSLTFSSIYIFKSYLFFRCLFIVSIYIYCCTIILNNSKNIGNNFYIKCKMSLYPYIAISLFLTTFYNGTPYTLISYITARYDNLFIFRPINDPLYNTFKYLITDNFFN